MTKPTAFALGQVNIGKLLAMGVLHDRWSLEDLDEPSPQWAALKRDRVRSLHPVDLSMPQALRTSGPAVSYPGAGTVTPFRNLAREWIAAHPLEWEAMMQARFQQQEAAATERPSAPRRITHSSAQPARAINPTQQVA